MGPEQPRRGSCLPSGDVPPAHGRARARTRCIDEEEIVCAGLHAQLRRPPLAQRGELGAEAASDAIGVGNEHPGTGRIELALRDARRGRLGAQGLGGLARGTGVRPDGDERHRVDGRAEGRRRGVQGRGAL